MRIRVLWFITAVSASVVYWMFSVAAPSSAMAVPAVLSLAGLLGIAIESENWLNRREADRAARRSLLAEAERMERDMHARVQTAVA